MFSSAIAFLLTLQAAAALPSADDVKAAVEDQANAACSGVAEADACGANRATAEIRGLACRPAGEEMASCRYEVRISSAAHRQAAWRAAETRFSFDLETSSWFIDEAAR